MSTKTVWLRCDWCEMTLEEDEADAAEEGWLRLEHEELEQPLDFCCLDCLISYL